MLRRQSPPNDLSRLEGISTTIDTSSLRPPPASVPGRYRPASLMQLVPPVTRAIGQSCPMPNHSKLQRVEDARSGLATSCANPTPQFDEFRLPLVQVFAEQLVAALHHPNRNEGRLPRLGRYGSIPVGGRIVR